MATAPTQASSPTTLTQGQSFTDTAGRTGVVNFNPNTGARLSSGQTVNYSGGGTVSNATPNYYVDFSQPDQQAIVQAGLQGKTNTANTFNTPVPTQNPIQQNPQLGPQQNGAPNTIPNTAFNPNQPISPTNTLPGSYNPDTTALTIDTSALKNKYNNAAATMSASGQPAPMSSAGGSKGIQSAIPQPPPSNPLANVFSTATQSPAYQQLMSDHAQAMSIQSQQQSLTQIYQQMSAQLGVQALDTQLMNMKNVIDGTEQDIRNEVTKAGGFATNSQVMALTDARNKQLVINYNNLLQTRNQAQQTLTTMMGLAEKDQANMMAMVDRQLNFDTQMVNMADKMQTNATDQLNKIVANIGYNGLQKMTNGDPYYTSLVEQSLGMPAGGLAKAASQPNLDQQLKQLQVAKLNQEVSGLNTSMPGTPGNAPLDTTSNSILKQTGLSLPAFFALTGQSSNLPRDAATRRQAFAEAQNWANQKGVDVSTLSSQYKAANDVLQKNIERANNTQIFAGEVTGSADALINAIDQKDLQPGLMGSLFGITKFKPTNLVALATGKQVNDPLTMKYGTQLQSMMNDYAGYLAASRGATAPDDSDLESAARVVSNGLNSGSTQAFKEAIQANEEKVVGVVNKAVQSAQDQVWKLFGVNRPNSTAGSGVSAGTVINYQGKNYTVDAQGNMTPQ